MKAAKPKDEPDPETLAGLDAKVVVRMEAGQRRTLWLPLLRAVSYSKRFNRRMKRAGLDWRATVIVQP